MREYSKYHASCWKPVTWLFCLKHTGLECDRRMECGELQEVLEISGFEWENWYLRNRWIRKNKIKGTLRVMTWFAEKLWDMIGVSD